MSVKKWCGDRCRRVAAYALEQLQQPSTYRGLILVVTAAGMHFSPATAEVIVTAGLAAAGLVGAAFSDHKRPKQPEAQVTKETGE